MQTEKIDLNEEKNRYILLLIFNSPPNINYI